MRGFSILAVLPALPLLLVLTGSLPAQQISRDDVVLHGRVQDAITGEPVPGALVFNADSSWVMLADSTGEFALPAPRGESYVLVVEQLGYAPTTFDLPESAPSRISVLSLQPAPLFLEGVTVVGESDLEVLVRTLDERRDSYSGSVRSFDRERIRSLGADNALDLVRRGQPQLRYCDNGMELCRRSRGGSFGSEPFSYVPILICIDEVYSPAPVSHLESIPIEHVVVAEFYGPQAFGTSSSARLTPTVGQVRIYTRQWMAMRAGRPRAMTPIDFGC